MTLEESKKEYITLTANQMAQDYDGFIKNLVLKYYGDYLKMIREFYGKNEKIINKILDSKDSKDALDISQILFVRSIVNIVSVFDDGEIDLNFKHIQNYREIKNKNSISEWDANVELLNKKLDKVEKNNTDKKDSALDFKELFMLANFMLNFLYNPEMRKDIAIELLNDAELTHSMNENSIENDVMNNIYKNNKSLSSYESNLSK
jgi:hypothetical protein